MSAQPITVLEIREIMAVYTLLIKKCTISEVAFLLAFGQECRSVIFGPISHFYDAPGNNLSERNPHDLRLGSENHRHQEKWPD